MVALAKWLFTLLLLLGAVRTGHEAGGPALAVVAFGLVGLFTVPALVPHSR